MSTDEQEETITVWTKLSLLKESEESDISNAVMINDYQFVVACDQYNHFGAKATGLCIYDTENGSHRNPNG